MNQETITQNNKLIAEFMGLPPNPYSPHLYAINPEIIDGELFAENWVNLLYHKSWDWMLPVCERIESHGFIVQITMCLAGSCKIWNYKGNYFGMESNNPIEAVWNTAVQFIEWHNQQQNSPAIVDRSGKPGGAAEDL